MVIGDPCSVSSRAVHIKCHLCPDSFFLIRIHTSDTLIPVGAPALSSPVLGTKMYKCVPL